MGTVFKARDRRLGRLVALKFLRNADAQTTKRFLQEARAQARIDHPGICRVYEVGEVNGKAYIAMQFIEGVPLHKKLHSLSLVEKVQIIKQVAEAVHVAHELHIIHRDIKPANITSVENVKPIVRESRLMPRTS
jgi:serine/threonine-protein kinase